MLSDVEVSMFDKDAAIFLYGFYFLLAILITAIIGLMAFSSARNISKSFKDVFTVVGWGFILSSCILIIGSFFTIPLLVENSSRKTEVINASNISQKLVNESDYAFIAVDGNNSLRDYLLKDNMICNSSTKDIEVPVVGVDKNNIIQNDSMSLSVSVDAKNKTCSYSVIS